MKTLADIQRMADLAQAMLRDALDSFVTQNVADARTIEAALNIILVSRHLERVGDHATNIAEDVIFIVAAQDVRHVAVAPEVTS